MRILSKAVLLPVAAGVAIGTVLAGHIKGAFASVTSGVAGAVAGRDRRERERPQHDHDDESED